MFSFRFLVSGCRFSVVGFQVVSSMRMPLKTENWQLFNLQNYLKITK